MRFFNYLSQVKPSLMQTLEAVKTNLRYNLNCVKIAIVEEFRPETMEVQCRIANKKLIGLNPDGSQILQDYPLITARCHFFGWGGIGATYPIEKGMEGILLFNDRELESWFINGGVNQLAYTRCHDLTDAIFICGIHSKPNLIEVLLDCLHLYNGETDIQLQQEKIITNTTDAEINVTEKIAVNAKDEVVKLSNSLDLEATTSTKVKTQDLTITNSTTTIAGVTTVNNSLTANSLHAVNGASGSFTTADSKTVVVTNGIITGIS